MRLNLEIAGMAALAFALLLGIALVAPPGRTGVIGGGVAFALHLLFGGTAALFVVLIALVGAIVFLEINVPRMIATLGGAACAYFVTFDAAVSASGHDGGALGRATAGSLHALIGDAGTWIVLVLAVLGLTVAVTGVSVKKVIGWCVARAAALRPPPRIAEGARAALNPASLREAFHLPALLPRAPQPLAAAAAGVADVPPRARTVAEPPRPALDDADPGEPYDVEDEAYDDDDDAYDDAYDDEDADDADELDADEDGDEADVADEPDDDGPGDVESGVQDTVPAPLAVAGEYEAVRPAYALPDVSAIFDAPQAQKTDDASRAHVLEDTLASFGVGAKVTHIERGPSITRYELRPERGVKISRISALADDLALALAATSVRIEAPIPGKSAVGIEVPNTTVSIVAIREILEHVPRTGSPLQMALGKDITGRPVFGDLGKMPHLLVAGATGAGKSVCLNCIIASLLVTNTPETLKLIMIDPKRVELTVYNGIPHLLKEVITDPAMAAGALNSITSEMDRRYESFARAGVRKIEEFNAKVAEGERLPYIVVVIDELADLMLIAPAKVEMLIMRLAQLARATGIHLVVATQRPSVDVITGLIKANIPSRIAFAVSSGVDSRVILDMSGAERLLGRGDMLYLPIDAPKPIRAQGALVSGLEVDRLVDWWRRQANLEHVETIEITPIREDDDRVGAERKVDELWYDAAKFLLDARVAKGEASVGSTAALQARFSIGHPRAVRLMRQLEELGVVGPNEGTKPRSVILESPADLERLADRVGRPAQTDLFSG